MSASHELLPWFANGTLSEAEAGAFRRHLAGCSDCKEELALVRSLQAELNAAGETFLEDHPSAQTVVAAARGELPADEAPAVRQHLSLCATCALEREWVGDDTQPVAQELGGSSPAVRPPSNVWKFVSAALAAGLAVALFWPRGGVELRTTHLETHLLTPVTRADGDANTLRWPTSESEPSPKVMIEVDYPAVAFPVALEIVDAAGSTRFRINAIHRDDLLEGLYLELLLAPRDFPPGDYRIRLRSEGDDDATVEIGFRVVSSEK